MGLRESLIKRIAVIVLLAFAGVRFADAHLHLCVDGSEAAPVTVHAKDHSHDDAHRHEADHSRDRDVHLFNAVLLKAGLDADVFVPPAAFVFAPRLPLAMELNARSQALPPPISPFHLRPPLRGPPR